MEHSQRAIFHAALAELAQLDKSDLEAALRKILSVDALLLGLALPDDNAHSPNEKFSLDAFAKGMRMSALLWPELAAAC